MGRYGLYWHQPVVLVCYMVILVSGSRKIVKDIIIFYSEILEYELCDIIEAENDREELGLL